MSETVELNQGEVKVKFETPVKEGKISFAELELKKESLVFEGGLLRLVFDFEKVKDISYFQMPTIFVQYEEEMEETHWQCDFNGEIISDKLDHHGHSSVILLNRDKLEKLEQHHENTLVLHAEFPKPVHLDVDNSYVNFFQ